MAHHINQGVILYSYVYMYGEVGVKNQTMLHIKPCQSGKLFTLLSHGALHSLRAPLKVTQ